MASLHQLHRPAHSLHRKKRVGRGQGSGRGKTAGRGGKGQKARTGNMHFEGFEGGQSPLQRRLPKFGFFSMNRVGYAIINVEQLERFEPGTVVDAGVLNRHGLVKQKSQYVKILGNGALTKPLTVHAHKFSAHAREAIQKAGGSIQEIPLRIHRPESAPKAHSGKGVKPGPSPKP